MKLGKKFIVFISVLLSSGLLAGCGGGKGEALEKIEPAEIQNHLAEWEENLPKDGGEESLYAKALRGLSVQKDGETVFAVSYEPREYKESFDYWDISVPYESLVSVDTERLYELFDVVSGLVPEEISEDALPTAEETGLKESGTRIFIAYDGQQAAGEKGKPEPTAAREIQIGQEDGKGHYYAKLSEDGETCLLKKAAVDAVLEVEPFSCILKIPALIQIDTVSEMAVSDGNQVRRMEREGESWKLDGKTISQEEFQKLYGEMLGVILSGELPKDAQAEDEREVLLVLRFLRNVEGAPDVEVRYEDYDESSVSVSVNGKRQFLAEKKDVEELRELLYK